MRIAICDDNTQELSRLSKLLNDYREKAQVRKAYMDQLFVEKGVE